MEKEYWKYKSLEEMSQEEWEALCDGCGRCCLYKLEDVDTHEYFYTSVVCRLLDTDTCRCTDYKNRNILEPGCVVLTPEKVRTLKWLPETCTYRLLAEGKPLPNWHPLISGDALTVHVAGISIRGKVTKEKDIDFQHLENYVDDSLK